MSEILRGQAPRVRCYECGSNDIFSVCHHCQRTRCEEHSPQVFRQGGVLVRTPDLASDDARPVSREFSGLRLGSHREAVFHCTDHAHVVHAVGRWLLSGLLAAVVGLLLLPVATTLGVVLLLGAGAVVGLSVAYQRRTTSADARPPLPIVPQVNGVDIVERLAGYVRLENGEYSSTVESISGQLTVDLSANDGHSALLAYRKKFRMTPTEPVEFTGGYLMFEGHVGLALRPGQSAVLANGTGISLGGHTEGHELFPMDPELRQREFSLNLDYDVQDSRTPREIPLWIVPSLVPRSDRRSLEIDLHWNRMGPQQQRLSLTTFQLIELEVPASWGNVESFAPDRVEIGRSGRRRVIRWKQVRTDGSGVNSLTLKLRFERAITEVPESTRADDVLAADDGLRTRLTLTGKVEATFHGLLSGVTGAGVYVAGGGSGHSAPTTTETKVAVTFDVSLRSIRYQNERVVTNANDADEFLGVVPDHRTVSELTDAISAADYYVKSVVEHPPHRDDRRLGVVNRVWDITGRRYIEVFPIDFDISLRGEQIAGATGLSGRTFAGITVKGAYAMGTLVEQPEVAGADRYPAVVDADGVDNELLTRIEDTWTRLHALVTEKLAKRAGPAQAVRAIGADEDDVVVGEVIGGSEDVRRGNGWAGRESELRRQIQVADELLLAGRITEETRRSIVARIQAELDDLGGLS